MKLKKIASLMLAGIMAVSMLAGCKDAASSSEPTEPETPVVGGYTATIYDLTGDTTKSVLKTKDNATLTTAFDRAEEQFMASYIDTFAQTSLSKVHGTNNAPGPIVLNALDNNLGVNYVVDTSSSDVSIFSQTDDKVYVSLYCITASVNETNLNKDVAAKVDTMMAGIKNNVSGSDTVDYYLTVDKFTKGSTNDGATVVMIAIERVTTKA